MQPTEERWLPVVGYEGFYEVSDQGRVRVLFHVTPCSDGRQRKVMPRVLMQHRRDSYPYVNLCARMTGARVKVHILVAAAFLGPRPEGMDVCHWNGVSNDNRLTNLRYDTHANNLADRKRTQTHCKWGHEYNDLTTYIKPTTGNRQCRACAAERKRRRR